MKPAYMWLEKYDGWTYNHAGSVHQLVMHIYNAKQPLLQHLHDAIPPLVGQTLPESRQKIEMGLTIMLRVFINLLYTHKMPNNHYCSAYMMPYPHLMAKHCLRVGRKSRFFPDLLGYRTKADTGDTHPVQETVHTHAFVE